MGGASDEHLQLPIATTGAALYSSSEDPAALSRQPSTRTVGTADGSVDSDGFPIDASLPKGTEQRNLTWWRLAMISFVFTCAGPGGLEQVVMAGGPLLALIGLFVVPIVYVWPQIFVVAELGSMMPTSAGNVVWVHRAFGRGAGFYNAWVFSLTNMFDVAAYPVLFGDYVVAIAYENEDDVPYMIRMACRFTGLVVGALACLLSAKDVSTFTSLGTVAVALFVLIAFSASTPNIRPRQWTHVEDPINFSQLGSSLLWLYTGWTSLGNLAGETKNGTVLIRGMSAALVGDMLLYVASLLAALTVAKTGDWKDGFFEIAFNRVINGIGPYFGASIVATSLALYISAMLCYTRGVWGMAEMGWAPQVLTRQLPTGAPHVAVLVHALVAFSLIWFDLGFIVQVEYTVAATSYLLTFGAFVRLRYSEPDTPRPYTVPGGMPFAWALTAVKAILMTGTMVAGLMDWRVAIAFGVVNIGVIAGYGWYSHRHPEEQEVARAKAHNESLDSDETAMTAVVALPDEEVEAHQAQKEAATVCAPSSLTH